jgi:ADP-ribose pyrophosphatase
MQPWQLLHQRLGPSGHVHVLTNQYRLPDGRDVEWDLLIGSDSVAVVALTDTEQVVLARQFRPGPARVLDELPGGGIAHGEAPEAAAARELAEETGYAGRVELVGSTWLAGNASRRRWAAVVTGARQPSDPTPDSGEFCEPVLLSLPEFRQHLRSGQLTDVDIGYLCLDHLGLL